MSDSIREALLEARAALMHPRDGWFDDRCNIALKSINAALAENPQVNAAAQEHPTSASLRAEASQPPASVPPVAAAPSGDELPPLPTSQMLVEVWEWDSEGKGLRQANQPYYTADQMRAYGKACRSGGA